jgi:hypothetical protein
VGNSLGPGRLYTLIDGEAVRLPSLYPYHHIPSISRVLTAGRSSLLSYISFIMSQSSSSSTLQALFNAALQDYKDETGISLVDHPFPRQLETCESVSSIIAILREQAQSFREFRENDGKLMKALNPSVDVLCSPSISSALSETIGLVTVVRRKAFISLPCS